MDHNWLFIGSIAVFAARDAWVVASRPRLGYLYVAVTFFAGLAAGGLGAALSAAEVDKWLSHPIFWGGGLTVHLGLALCSLRRAGTAAAGGWVEPMPSPVFAVALVLLVRIVLERTNALGGLETGIAVAVGYLLLVTAFGAGVKKIGGSGLGTRLVVWSHLMAILLVLLSTVSTGWGTVQRKAAAPTGEDGADWAAALGVVSVIALSFTWRRYRSRNSTLSRSR